MSSNWLFFTKSDLTVQVIFVYLNRRNHTHSIVGYRRQWRNTLYCLQELTRWRHVNSRYWDVPCFSDQTYCSSSIPDFTQPNVTWSEICNNIPCLTLNGSQLKASRWWYNIWVSFWYANGDVCVTYACSVLIWVFVWWMWIDKDSRAALWHTHTHSCGLQMEWAAPEG